ncbi:response regulator transcription factor [Microvirga alba]|uniref:response regulator transcription factor n=1 Tax=Microvirga alba TaxID=2791025 RepID=UPI002D21D4A9|nr:response regulator transcription factor [Microvirga alba]
MAAAARIALIADVDVYFRLAVGGLLMREFGFSDVVEAQSFDEARGHLLEQADVSVALLDLSTLGMKDAASLRMVRSCFPETKVAVTSVSNSRRSILSALESGVHGYIPKSLSIAELTAALRLVLGGGIYVPPSLAEVAPQIPDAAIRLPDLSAFSDAMARSPLTPRQMDVLELLVQGKPNKEIASVLKLGEGTVKIHVAAIFRYLGVNNRAAVAAASARPNPSRKLSLLRRPPHEGLHVE